MKAATEGASLLLAHLEVPVRQDTLLSGFEPTCGPTSYVRKLLQEIGFESCHPGTDSS
jgi:hypothetical protein